MFTEITIGLAALLLLALVYGTVDAVKAKRKTKRNEG